MTTLDMSSLRIALVADELTSTCLASECSVINITPFNFRWKLRFGKPDFLFVESAWLGKRNSWKYKIASYPDHPSRSNRVLAKLVSYARELGIPTIFWNKEDDIHFERFISSACLFDHILTVDENCIPRYRDYVAPDASVNVMMFPVQKSMHYFREHDKKIDRANFVGSYSNHIHSKRREWQDILFRACVETGVPVDIFDRNSQRKSENYRFPSYPGIHVHRSVPHIMTAEIYSRYIISLNINTIETSPSMYSRRLVEIIACGGIAVTNPTPAIERYFKDYCHIVSGYAEALEIISRLKSAPPKIDRDRAMAGSEYILREHTWTNRLNEICKVLKI